MRNATQPTLSIVIPVYNEEAVLPVLIGRLRGFVERLAPLDVEIILVDDHSTDRSPDLLKEICRSDRTIPVCPTGQEQRQPCGHTRRSRPGARRLCGVSRR